MNDTEAIYALECQCFPNEHYSLKNLSETLALPYCIHYIHYEDKIPIGYIIGTCSFGEAEIHHIGVLNSFRRKGFGERIINEFTAKSKADRILLEVRSKNKGALALYKKCGFTEIGKRKKYYGDDDAVIMEKKTP